MIIRSREVQNLNGLETQEKQWGTDDEAYHSAGELPLALRSWSLYSSQVFSRLDETTHLVERNLFA